MANLQQQQQQHQKQQQQWVPDHVAVGIGNDMAHQETKHSRSLEASPRLVGLPSTIPFIKQVNGGIYTNTGQDATTGRDTTLLLLAQTKSGCNILFQAYKIQTLAGSISRPTRSRHGEAPKVSK